MSSAEDFAPVDDCQTWPDDRMSRHESPHPVPASGQRVRPDVRAEVARAPETGGCDADRSGAPVVGRLLALIEDGLAALVVHPGQSGRAALRAQTVVDLQGTHIGRPVLLVFDHGDPERPIVTGLIRGDGDAPVLPLPGSVALEADGERLVVSARDRLVLRCGEASITLTRSGKVLIRGRYIVSESSGAHRIRGGSVQLN